MYNYIINFKNSQNYNKFLVYLFVLTILSLFFPIRHVFLTKEAYLTGGYSDFTSFSFYLSDILILLLAFMTFLPRGINLNHVAKSLKWLILAIFVIFFLHFGLNIRLNAYLLVKWLELIVAYGTFSVLFKQNGLKNLFLKLFVLLCSLESILALVQFARQTSIGLFRLGESHLAPNILGVAKIVSGGTVFIRGYGTFPHPNPFSAFLLTGILITIYLLISSTAKRWQVLYSILLFINILGLTVTFSRGAYLALAAGLVIFFGSMCFLPPLAEGGLGGVNKRRSFAIIITLINIVISFFLFRPFLLTRATFSDQSTIARKFYDVAGLKMAIKNPIFGIGLGESILQMEKYGGKTLAPWDKQPPHNYFIIAAAEMGIPAMLILVWIFFSHLWQLIKKLRLRPSPYLYSLFSILLSLFLLMQFDHYFYTLNQTQLLLWIFLALIVAEIKIVSPVQERPKPESVVIP